MLLGLFQKLSWGVGAACVAGYDHNVKPWMVEETTQPLGQISIRILAMRNQCVRRGGGGAMITGPTRHLMSEAKTPQPQDTFLLPPTPGQFLEQPLTQFS